MSSVPNRTVAPVRSAAAPARPLALPEFDPNFLRRLPDAGERARVVDKWMVQRIKQAQRTSQTLEKRLKVLNQAGAGVQTDRGDVGLASGIRVSVMTF